jgi:hypothetical protein
MESRLIHKVGEMKTSPAYMDHQINELFNRMVELFNKMVFLEAKLLEIEKNTMHKKTGPVVLE